MVALVLSGIFLLIAVTSQPAKGSGRDISLDINTLIKLGDPQKILATLRQVARGAHSCGVREVPHMKKMNLKNTSVVCNDGSPAGYYIRKSYGSREWIVFLEGGMYCSDRTSCHARWVNTRRLMTSRLWTNKKKGEGILSWDPEQNPFLFKANVVYIPYCSSDIWSGTYKDHKKGVFSFMGSLIVDEVVKDLIPQGLFRGRRLLLAGSSAGGTGVLLNLDRVAEFLSRRAPGLEVRGLADSGWFIDNKPYKSHGNANPCTDVQTCSPIDGIKRGLRLWHGKVPASCKANYPAKDHWKCYLGYKIYRTLKTPVFIVQYLFDEFQIQANRVGAPISPIQWKYIHTVGTDIKKTLENVTAVFAPACMSHMIIARNEWNEVSIGGVTLPEAVMCWMSSSEEFNVHSNKAINTNGSINSRKSENLLGDDPRSAHRKRHNRNRRRQNRRRGKHGKWGRNRGRRRVRSKRSPISSSGYHSKHNRLIHSNKCSHHHVNTCGWPQCNFKCPKIHNPFTGEEMDFIDLMMQFGLDLSSIANALGMDLKTLKSMDHDQLMKMLTQQR